MELTGTLAQAEWDAHRPAVFGAAYRILGTVAKAEDVTHEVWLRAAAADRVHIELPFFPRADERVAA